MKVSFALGLARWKVVAMSWNTSVNDEAAKTTTSPETAEPGLAAGVVWAAPGVGALVGWAPADPARSNYPHHSIG